MIGDFIWAIITNFVEILVIILKKSSDFLSVFFGNKFIYFNDTYFLYKNYLYVSIELRPIEKSVISMLNNVLSNPVLLIK